MNFIAKEVPFSVNTPSLKKDKSQVVNNANRSNVGLSNSYLIPNIKPMATRKIKYKYADELVSDMIQHPGERYFCIVNGTFIFGDFIEAFIVRNNFLVNDLSITTLGYNQNNVDSLANLINGGYVEKLNLIASAEFYGWERGRLKRDEIAEKIGDAEFDKYNLIPYTYRILDNGVCDFQYGIADVHTKIVNIKTACGKHICIHGSANLRSSGNIEQFMIEYDYDMWCFNQEIIETMLSICKTIKKPVRKSLLWENIK